MRKFLQKLIKNPWCSVGTGVLIFISALIAYGLAMFFLFLVFIATGIATAANATDAANLTAQEELIRLSKVKTKVKK